MWKTFLLTVLGFFGVLALGYGIVIIFPSERHAALMAQVVKDSQASLDEIQKQAPDPEKNGWKSPTFLPYWGRRGMEFVDGSPVSKVVDAWLTQTNLGEAGKKIDHKAKQSSKDAAYTQALTDFEKLAPELLASMNKPVFTAPDTAPPSYTTPTLNFLAVRGCAQGMVGLAAARAAQGRVPEALEMLTSVLHLGESMREPRGMLNEVIITAVEVSGAEGYLGAIDPHSAAPMEAWSKFAAMASQAVPKEDAFAKTLESEIMMADNTFVELPNSPTQAGFPSLVTLPGFLPREQRIFHNQIGDILLAVRAGTPTPSPPANASFMDLVSGKSGIYADMMVPNTTKVPAVLESRRRVLVAASISAGVSAYLTKNGSLPPTVADIRTVAEIPSDEVLKAAESSYSIKDGKAVITVPANTPTMLDNLALYGAPAWLKVDKTQLTVTI